MFKLTDRVAIITGGSGFLGRQHMEAIKGAGGIPIIADITRGIDITNSESVSGLLKQVLSDYGRIDILINNAANNPKLGASESRLENFSMDVWEDDLAVGLTGAFICSKIIGTEMAKRGGGVIVNVASDLGLIAPDQRIYRKDWWSKDDDQPVKPVTYSVVKHGLIGLTKYLATYWATKHVRVNALCPGGMYHDQPEEFVVKLASLIPMGRMAELNEYQGALIFLCSDASSYMTGANLVIDGGRTCW